MRRKQVKLTLVILILSVSCTLSAGAIYGMQEIRNEKVKNEKKDTKTSGISM
jgi:hypothetical protein